MNNNNKKLSTTSSSNSKLSKKTEMTNLSSTSAGQLLNGNHFRSDTTKPEIVSTTISDCGDNKYNTGYGINSATTAKSDMDLCVRLLSENSTDKDDENNTKNNKPVKKRLSL